MQVDWTWAVERMDGEDVFDTIYCNSYADAVETAGHFEGSNTVLVCDTFDGGINSRGWAYVVEGKLEDWASDGYGENLRKTTKKHQTVVTKHLQNGCAGGTA